MTIAAPVLGLGFGLALRLWGGAAALRELVFTTILAVLLMELLLSRFRKLPFMALLLLYAGPRAPLIRASLLGRLPGPTRLYLVSAPHRARHFSEMGRGLDAAELRRLQRATTAPVAAFYYDYAIWRGRPITVARMTPNLPPLLGVRSPPLLLPMATPGFCADFGCEGRLDLDYRPVDRLARVPASLAFVLRPAQFWLPLNAPVPDGRRVFADATAPVPGFASEPLADYLLDDLVLARWGGEAVLAFWLLWAASHVIHILAGPERRHWKNARAYWSYALLGTGRSAFCSRCCGAIGSNSPANSISSWRFRCCSLIACWRWLACAPARAISACGAASA